MLVAFRVEAPAAVEDTVIAALWENGTTGLHVQPSAPEVIVLAAYFPDRHGLEADLRASLSPCGVTVLERTPVPDVDWVARFRESFGAFRVGRFHVVPAWEEPAATEDARAIPLRILPARAFGTGTHESTRLCLTALEALAARGPLGRAVDVGTGTGILAVAAALLGSPAVTAIDIDPEAIASAALHARMNAVDLHLARGDGGRPLLRARFDLVLANLTAPLLLERREEIAALCAPSASLVLAGFLEEDAAQIAAAYGALGVADVRTDGEWAALVVEKTA